MQCSCPQEKSIAQVRLIAWLGALAIMLVSMTAQADNPSARTSDFGSQSSADANWLERFNVSGKAGINLAMFTGPGTAEESVSYSYRTDISIGGAVGLRLTEIVAVQGEISFTAKGPYGAIDGMHAGTYYLKYLEMPLLARVTLPVSGAIAYHADIGPALAVLLDADLVLVDGRKFDITGVTESVDIGALIGIGAAVEIGGRGAVTIDIRYNRGLRSFSQTATSDEDKIMNQSVYFLVGYRANLGDLLHGFRRKAPPPAHKSPSAPEPDAAPTARTGEITPGASAAVHLGYGRPLATGPLHQ